MTIEEFETQLRAWGKKVRNDMRQRLGSTHGSGDLAKKIKVSIGESRDTSTHFVGFKFNRYGVFVAYGVGRGWIRQDGQVVAGSRVKKGSELYEQLKKRGYRARDIRKYAVGGGKSRKSRKSIDWFDSAIRDNVEMLADLASEYYGDYSMEQMVEILDEMINRMSILKKG